METDISRASAGEVVEPLCGFEGDVGRGTTESCKRSNCAENGVEGVTDGVGERRFGGFATGKEMITIGVEWFGARAGGRGELVGEGRDAEFSLEEEGEEVAGESIVGVLTGEAVKGKASEWAEEGWKCKFDVRGRAGEGLFETLDLMVVVQAVGCAVCVGVGEIVVEIIAWR